MAAKGVGVVLVISGGRLAGIISERDYARKVILQGRSSEDTLVREIMTSDLITVTPEHSAEECMRLVTDHGIHHLPLLDRGELAGIISIGDLVNAIIAHQAHMIGQLHTYIGGNYTA
jgi:CBS domain-containing protein